MWYYLQMSVESNASNTTFPQPHEQSRQALLSDIIACLSGYNAMDESQAIDRSVLYEYFENATKYKAPPCTFSPTEIDTAIGELAAAKEISVLAQDNLERISLSQELTEHHDREIEQCVILGLFKGISVSRDMLKK